jgi:NAD(P)-dependent dehydrogenase (short-subunit alcohol dehydrogenase family)
VTAGASGIGRAAAQLFCREGAKVAVADIGAGGGEATVRGIREAGGEAFFLPTDVSRASDVSALVDKVIERWGRLDCAFNNAAILGEIVSVVDHKEAP